MIYAVGEIFLVVLGILIAVQINNWNEKEKLKHLEIKTLSELRTSFTSDLRDIHTNLELHRAALNSCEQLLKAFDQKLPYHDSLNPHFGQFSNVSVFINSTGAYEALKSRGMDIISNDSLRTQIVNIHDVIYHYLKLNEREFDMYDMQENKQFMFKNMTDWKFFTSAKPQDYQQLSTDTSFRNRLEYTIQGRRMTISTYESAENECKSLIAKLSQEIDQLSD